MASHDYVFETRWQVPGTVDEIADVLMDATGLVRWWPSVYLDVTERAPGDPVTRVGRVIDLYTKGWLPYTLRWSFRITENRHPRGFSLEATGDFAGTGVWTFEPSGDDVVIVYDWRIRAEKALLRYFSFVMKPMFSANHHWAMRKGEESLRLELARRRARTDEERALIASPPKTTFRWMMRKPKLAEAR